MTTPRPANYNTIDKNNWKTNPLVWTAFACGFLVSQGLSLLWKFQTAYTVAVPSTASAISPESSLFRAYESKVQQLCSSSSHNGTTNPLEKESSSTGKPHHGDYSLTAFDALSQHAYDILALYQPPPSISRSIFRVEEWNDKRTQGGLLDPDRSMIGRVYGKAQSVFEWGLGESTWIARHVQVPRYLGIDSDPSYMNATRTELQTSHFRFLLADIGETVDWGFPADRDLPKNWFSYQVAPLMAERAPFDVYLVDGRYRVGCMLVAFLHASSRGAKQTPIVLVHDCDRAGYHVADYLLFKEESGGILCQYTRRPETTDEQLLELWYQHFANVA